MKLYSVTSSLIPLTIILVGLCSFFDFLYYDVIMTSQRKVLNNARVALGEFGIRICNKKTSVRFLGVRSIIPPTKFESVGGRSQLCLVNFTRHCTTVG